MKGIFLCSLCLLLLLTGCGVEIGLKTGNDTPAGGNVSSGGQPQVQNTDVETNEGSVGTGELVSFDIEQYGGDWYNKDYSETVQKDTEEFMYEYGSWLSLDTKYNKVSIYTTSSAPANRIAQVETTYEIKDSKAEFKFDDDGWGNSGHGTIEFRNDELVVDITLTTKVDVNWAMFNGKLDFTRNKNVSEVSISTAYEESNETAADIGDTLIDDSSVMVIRFEGVAFDIEKPIDYRGLTDLTADELGILRNALYAKYGHTFKTKKYSDYFSGFDWYSPSQEDVNSKLTKDDKSSIALIQKVERFHESKIQLSDEEKTMVGTWHMGAGVGAGYSDVYRFYDDGTYKYNISQMVLDDRDLAHAGKWFILDGSLYLLKQREGVLVGGELIDAENPSSGTEMEIVNAQYIIKTLNVSVPVVLKLSFDSDKIVKDYVSDGVLIGGYDFYKLSERPDDYDGIDI